MALNWFSSLEMFDSLWFTEVGMDLMMFPGWFDFLLTYWVVLLGFVYGRYVPSWRLKVMSRKLVAFKLWSTVILSPCFLNSVMMDLAMRLASHFDLLCSTASRRLGKVQVRVG